MTAEAENLNFRAAESAQFVRATGTESVQAFKQDRYSSKMDQERVATTDHDSRYHHYHIERRVDGLIVGFRHLSGLMNTAESESLMDVKPIDLAKVPSRD